MPKDSAFLMEQGVERQICSGPERAHPLMPSSGAVADVAGPACERRAASRSESAAQVLFNLLPGKLCRDAGLRSRLARVATRGGPFEHTLHDALADAGNPKQVIGHAELPRRRFDRGS